MRIGMVIVFVAGLAQAESPKAAAQPAKTQPAKAAEPAKPAAEPAKPAAAEPAKPANPLSMSMGFLYERVKKFLVDSAEAMPDKDYAFKPTPDVRSYAQLIGHVADAQYMFCSAVKHEAQPKKDIEKTVTSKAELKKALTEAFAYCDSVYSGSTDASLLQPVELFGGKRGPMTKFIAMDINIAHDNEHYGNIVTYLRLKKIVPPSTGADGSPR
jgi:uncharacterized damage-inducible protein DinB